MFKPDLYISLNVYLYDDLLLYWGVMIICDWIWEKPASMHIYKYVEIQFWNIKYNILRMQEAACVPFSTNP